MRDSWQLRWQISGLFLCLKIVFKISICAAAPFRICFFRMNNRVTMYSCVRNLDVALAVPTSSPNVTLPYSPPSLWIDLFRSIVAATKFIYIIGWSIQTNIKMLRWDMKLCIPKQAVRIYQYVPQQKWGATILDIKTLVIVRQVTVIKILAGLGDG